MTHSFKRMWCTHGALQESRGEGCRDYDSRFTDVKQVSSCALSVSSWIVKPKGNEVDATHPASLPRNWYFHRDEGEQADINRYMSDKLHTVITQSHSHWMSERGNGKGGGKGGAKRDRHTLRENARWYRVQLVVGLLAVLVLSGCQRLSSRRPELYCQNLIQDAAVYTKHANRKTVLTMDVLYALKRQGSNAL
ncbi:hypothetical protein JG687_00017414 [Phytophthora cactorum]|uniref:Histone-fold n=1 Tax=Phytophthora cactorum TaxID=29920 RepID=A0A8T1TRL9_9STRA|nr:Histone-fold [Phytophthora cactorum]KAG6945224.1 hypothetical protein JG687_00017414 [Phytophthora cactorum]